MGRAKLKMELISNEKARFSTFQKRKKGLKKKAYELSTLCDVNVCMIIYSPRQNDQYPTEPETWPTNPYEIHRMIELFKKRTEQDRTTRTLDLSHFFMDRTKKVEEALVKLRKKNDNEAKYPTWDDQYNNLSEDYLRELSSMLEKRLAIAKSQLEVTKGKEVNMAGGMIDCTPTLQNHPYNFMMDEYTSRNSMMQLKYLREQQQSIPSSANHHPQLHYYPTTDQPQPQPQPQLQPQRGGHYYPTTHDQPQPQPQRGGFMPQLDPYSTNSMMMIMNGNGGYCNQLGGAGSSSNVVYPMDGSIYVDPPMPLPLQLPNINMMDNNNPLYMPYPAVMSTAPSQVHAAPFQLKQQYYHHHEVDDFQMKNKN